MIYLLKALLLTILLEGITAYLFKVRACLDQLSLLGINCITNPIINLLLMIVAYYFGTGVIWQICMIILEIVVVIVEAILIKRVMNVQRPLLLSFVINLVSCLTGLFIF